MDELKQFYKSALQARIEAIETAATTMDADPAGARATIRRFAHSLRGSGTTYGFPQITEAAGAVEDASDEDLQPRMKELLKTMKAVAAEV